MRAPRFWWREQVGIAAAMLAPLAGAYGAYAAWRIRRPSRHRPPLPVICVGNFTVGGVGKTPTAIALCRLMTGLGTTPGFLTRGYRGSERGPLLVDLERDDVRQTGDEPRLLAAIAPTVISGDRPLGARALSAIGADAIIMDDGFQNPRLGKDLSLIVVDAEAGFGNGMVVPAGPLRAPLTAQIKQAHAMVLISEGTDREDVVRVAATSGKPLLRARILPTGSAKWAGAKVFAFAGIGNPGRYLRSVESAGAIIVGSRVFPDHHLYTQNEARDLLKRAEVSGGRLVTTAKDYVRLAAGRDAIGELRMLSDVFEIRIVFDDPPTVEQMLSAAIDAAGARRNLA